SFADGSPYPITSSTVGAATPCNLVSADAAIKTLGSSVFCREKRSKNFPVSCHYLPKCCLQQCENFKTAPKNSSKIILCIKWGKAVQENWRTASSCKLHRERTLPHSMNGRPPSRTSLEQTPNSKIVARYLLRRIARPTAIVYVACTTIDSVI